MFVVIIFVYPVLITWMVLYCAVTVPHLWHTNGSRWPEAPLPAQPGGTHLWSAAAVPGHRLHLPHSAESRRWRQTQLDCSWSSRIPYSEKQERDSLEQPQVNVPVLLVFCRAAVKIRVHLFLTMSRDVTEYGCCHCGLLLKRLVKSRRRDFHNVGMFSNRGSTYLLLNTLNEICQF